MVAVLLLLLVGLLLPAAEAFTLELKDATSFTFADGAEFRDKPLANSGGSGPLIRSGGPGQLSSATAVEASPLPIKRVQLDFDYLVGYESGGGEAPVVSVWVHDTPDASAAGGKQVYSSPPLPCEKKGKRHCYGTCDEKDQKDCYSPGVSVDAVCADCTGT